MGGFRGWVPSAWRGWVPLVLRFCTLKSDRKAETGLSWTKQRGKNCSVLVPFIAWRSKGLSWFELGKAARKELPLRADWRLDLPRSDYRQRRVVASNYTTSTFQLGEAARQELLGACPFHHMEVERSELV